MKLITYQKVFKKEDLKEIRDKIEDIKKDVIGESKTESWALLRLIEDALEHNNFGHEIVIEKYVNIDGLFSDSPMIHIKWVVRERLTTD